MKEFVTANGRVFECTNVNTRTGYIRMTMENQDRDGLEAFFRDVTALTVAFEGAGEPHGVYTRPDYVLEYKSTTSYGDGSVAVTMKILTQQEVDVADLKQSQAEQDELLAELMFGNQS